MPETQTFKLTAPNGQMLRITGDHVPTEAEMHDIFAKAGVETGAVPEIARDATGRPRVSSNLSDAPDSGLSQWFETHLRPALESAAHPQTLTDVASLLLSPTDATRGVGIAVLQKAVAALKAAPAAAIRTAAAAGDLVHPDVIGAVSPRAGKVVEMAQRLRAKLPESAATVPEAIAAPVAPAASAPAAPAHPPAPVARTTAPESIAAPAPSGPPPVTLPEGTTVPPATAQYYPQKFLNEVALQAKRQGVSLSDGEYAVAHGLTEQGASAAEAVRQIGATRAATAPPATSAAPKLKLAGQEQREYLRLRNQGLTHQQAEDLIVSQRALSGSLNLPSGEQVRQSVAERNASGKWGSDK